MRDPSASTTARARRTSRRTRVAVAMVAVVSVSACGDSNGSTLEQPARSAAAVTGDGRSSIDRPDDSDAPQLKALYVLPADGADRQLDLDGTIATSIEAIQHWLGEQTGGTQLRFDTVGGELDIGFVRLDRTAAELASAGVYLRDELERDLRSRGFDDTNTLYAVYYDGTATTACGGGAWPPRLPGRVAAMYLDGRPPDAPACSTSSIGASRTSPSYLDIAMLHEIFHTMGAAPACAPNHALDGHVAAPVNDLMYAGDEPWAAPYVLDADRDDYWGHDLTDCPDLARSALLEPMPRNATLPPGWDD